MLEEQVVVITGGSRGIGRAVALGMARQRAHVVVVGRDGGVAREVVTAIADQGGPAAAFEAVDVSDGRAVKDMVQRTVDRFGRIDVLITLAAVVAPAAFLDITQQQWEHVLAVNLTGTFLCVQAVLAHMIGRGRGKIITTTSLAGLRSGVSGIDYAASKAGVIALTQTVARQLRDQRHNVTLNCVSPVAETRMSEALARFRGVSLEQFRTDRPGGAMPTPDDMVATYVFLASAAADYMTGQVIAVDNGRSL